MFLATQLSMTVAAMRRQMGNDEFVRWGVYYARKAQREALAQKLANAKRSGG